MKKEIFEEFVKNLDLEKNKWIQLSEIESILLKGGIGVYPNWMHMRFLIKDNCDILVQHGTSLPYGARLNSAYQISQNGMAILFPPKNPISKTQYYSDFRLPKGGDILRVFDGSKVVDEIVISDTTSAGNAFSIKLSRPMLHRDRILFSFYDPMEYVPDKCMHSTIVEGVFMKFYENSGKIKKSLLFHDIIKCKDITEIHLKVRGSDNNNKVYKIKE